MPSVADVVARVSNAAFGNRLVTNVLRGQVAEAIVAMALEPEWHWCAADYAAWDFVRADGRRLEVKQSARRQSWSIGGDIVARRSFDVRPRTGWYEGPTWIDAPGRAADLYVFCWHDRSDDAADHCDPSQWQFYVVQTASLPAVERLALSKVQQSSDACSFAELRGRVDDVAR